MIHYKVKGSPCSWANPSNAQHSARATVGLGVEYALVLPNGKRLAVDSKWVGAGLLERLAQLAPGPERDSVADEVEKALQRRAKEATQYIDATSTLPWALVAVPDAAYSVCRRAHVEAFRTGVVLIPYSLIVPYLLTLYRLQLQFAHGVDEERLESTLAEAERILERIDRILENSIARAATMIQNAHGESRRLVGVVKGSLRGLRAEPEADESLAPDGSQEPAEANPQSSLPR